MTFRPPVIEALRHARLEIDALIDAIQQQSGVLVVRDEIIERVQQLYLSWFSSIRTGLHSLGVDERVLNPADEGFRRLIHLAGRRSRKNQYLLVLPRLRNVLVQQVLLDVAQRISTVPEIPARPQTASVIPEIPDLPNEFVPNALLGWIPGMRNFLRQNAFDRNVFVMVAYRENLAGLIGRLRDALSELDLNAVVARDHRLTDDLYNPIACLLCCGYGIAVFGPPERRQVHNPNVVYELGMMQLLKRPCIILKHTRLRVMPADILSRLYEVYGSDDQGVGLVQEWWAKVSRS